MTEYGRIHTDGSRSGGQPVLKPCPFCGGEASADGVTRYTKGGSDAWWDDGTEVRDAFFVSCISCGGNRRNIVGGQQTKALAIAAWNTRQPTQSDVNERLGAWLSAALDDPNCSDAFKQDINDWFASQPTQSDALRCALQTARDYVADVAEGNIHFNDNIKAMAAEDLTLIDAALQEQSE